VRAPDLALLDVALPGLSGYEVCRRLREQFGEELPIMFMSVRTGRAVRSHGWSLPRRDDYLVKPFELEELLALVRKHRRRVTNSGTALRSRAHCTPVRGAEFARRRP